MRPVVFAGPSLHGLAPAQRAGCDLRPPAACGDVLAAFRGGARVIGLIDGVFGDTASVWHKEILCALADGGCVYGAASMGALRAAECHAFGMVGVGRIFEAYRSGQRVADADVAVLHGPAELGYVPLTVALVDAEATIARLGGDGRVTDGEAEELLAAARRLGFRDRIWPAVLAGTGIGGDRAAAILAAVRQDGFSQKRADAVELLARLRQPVAGDAAPPPLTLNRTMFLASLQARRPG